MKQEKFKAINLIRELIVRIDNNLDNFPKKDIEIKNRIRNLSYDLLEYIYEANTTSKNEFKIELLDKSVAKIKVIDFLVNLSYDKQIINNKRYIKLGEAMDEILKYINGWKKAIYNKQGTVDGVQEYLLLVVWLASPYVNCNSNNANFGMRNVNNENVNNNNLFNSNDNSNNNNNGVRPVDSINCGYVIICCIRDNIETNCCPVISLN